MSVPRMGESPKSRKDNGDRKPGMDSSSNGTKAGGRSSGSGAQASNTANGSNSSKVRVVGRIRPLAKYELQKGSRAIVTKVPGSGGRGDPETLQIDSENNDNGAPATNRWFELDAVLDETSTQQDVYEKSGARSAIAEDLFCGYNATILAYGQTGSGKTFTMGTAQQTKDEENEDDETNGVIPRACKDLFDNVQLKCDGQAQVNCSYMEVYNEEIRDLLVDTKQPGAKSSQQTQLRIRETLDGQIYVRGLTERQVTSPFDVYKIMEEANKRRVVASTKMNATSSRSHAICVLKIKGVIVVPSDENENQENSKPSGGDNDDGISRTFEAKLTLVDLAGSERLKKTQAKGSRAKEGISINKGLFVLGQVVSALAEKGRLLSEIENSSSSDAKANQKRKKTLLSLQKPPYRDSKLTRLLQDSLGGNSRTIMIACVSPAEFNVEETINTLRYATQARNISNVSTANLVETISQSEARKLKRENTLLKTQIEELEAQIAKLTQDVTEDDLSRSMSIIWHEKDKQQQQEEQQSTGSATGEEGGGGGGLRGFFQKEEARDIIAAAVDDDKDKTTHRSNVNNTRDTSNKSSSNKIGLDDHFSRHSFAEDIEIDCGHDDDETKDSVSLLPDDIMALKGLSPKGRARNRRNLVRSSGDSVSALSLGNFSTASVRTIEEVEEENTELEARLKLAEKDLRATARDTAVELPKLKKRVRQLEDSLAESKLVEDEARDLREQLNEAKVDRESAQRAAQQLANFMERQKNTTGFRGDELSMQKVEYSHQKLNEDWVRFVVVVLNSFKEEMRLLGDYFQMVIQIVESPHVMNLLGLLKKEGGTQGDGQQPPVGGVRGWWKNNTNKEQRNREMGATLLREHLNFFNERLVEIEDEVNLRSDSIDVVLESLRNVRGHLEETLEDEVIEASTSTSSSSQGHKILSQLTELMSGKLFNTTFQNRLMAEAM